MGVKLTWPSKRQPLSEDRPDQEKEILDLLDFSKQKPQFIYQNPKMKPAPSMFTEREAQPLAATAPLAKSPPVPPTQTLAAAPPPPDLPSPTGGLENYEGLGSYNTAQVAPGAPSVEKEFPWAKAFGMAANMTKPKAEPTVKPPSFGTPGPLRASPITKGLPDPVLMALFGKPI